MISPKLPFRADLLKISPSEAMDKHGSRVYVTVNDEEWGDPYLQKKLVRGLTDLDYAVVVAELQLFGTTGDKHNTFEVYLVPPEGHQLLIKYLGRVHTKKKDKDEADALRSRLRKAVLAFIRDEDEKS